MTGRSEEAFVESCGTVQRKAVEGVNGDFGSRRHNGVGWLTLRELEKLPFTSILRKVLDALRRSTQRSDLPLPSMGRGNEGEG